MNDTQARHRWVQTNINIQKVPDYGRFEYMTQDEYEECIDRYVDSCISFAPGYSTQEGFTEWCKGELKKQLRTFGGIGREMTVRFVEDEAAETGIFKFDETETFMSPFEINSDEESYREAMAGGGTAISKVINPPLIKPSARGTKLPAHLNLSELGRFV